MMSPLTILRAKQRGQALPIVVIILPFLVVFALFVVEVAERWLEVAMLEDALQQATRSAVQTLDYAALARGENLLRAGEDCRRVTVDSAGPCAEVVEVAARIFEINLTGIRGLAESPDDLIARVEWTVLPNGGTCTYTSSESVTHATPLICAEMRPVMRGIVGWGDYTPFITAADTLDPVQ